MKQENDDMTQLNGQSRLNKLLKDKYENNLKLKLPLERYIIILSFIK